MGRANTLVPHVVAALQKGRELTSVELAAEAGCSPNTARWALRRAQQQHPQIRTRPEDWNQGAGRPRMGAPRLSYFWMPQ